MADPFEVESARLDERFTFSNHKFVKQELRALVAQLEDRLQKIETGPQKTYAEELLALQADARTAVTDALTPFFEDLSEIASLGGIFVAESSSTVLMTIGPKTFTVTGEAARARFAPTSYMAARCKSDTTKILLGQVTSYNHVSGDLVIAVSTIGGSPAGGETHNDWDLLPTPPPTALPYVDGGVFGGMDGTGITRVPIRQRRSNIATDAPLSADLLDGELGLNFRDAKLFWRNEAAAIQTSKLFVGDIGDVAVRSDADQYSSWTSARRNQAQRNIRRTLSYVTSNVTIDPTADMARPFIHDSATDHNFTLPTLAAAGDGFRFKLRTINTNGRGGIVTLVRSGSETIDGVNANFAVPAGQSIEVVADATNGWRIYGLNRSPTIHSVLQTVTGVSALVVPLAKGYTRYMLRLQRFLKPANAASNLNGFASNDAGSTYGSTYHRNYAYNSAASTWTTATLLSAGTFIFNVGHTSSSQSLNGQLELYPGGFAGDSPSVEGISFGYNGGIGPTTTVFSSTISGLGSGAIVDTMKFQWADGDDVVGQVFVVGIL